MKTTKQEAFELFSEMLNAGKGLISSFLAQQCAIITVNKLYYVTGDEYWIKVRDEIKKIKL
jgi:hypothetical protein